MRTVRIATTSFLLEDQDHTIEMNMDRALSYVQEASDRGADIVCLPETVTTNNVSTDYQRYAEPYPGEFTEMFCAGARECKINLVAPYLVRADGKVYNQATVIDRRGSVVGVYRKVQPTGAELGYVSQGDSLPVFELDVGRVAVMICLDIYFPEIVRIYAFKGAEIVFWPTVTHGPTQEALRAQLTARAVDNSIIMVESNLAGHPPYAPYAGRYRPATARIFDHNGDILAQTGRRHGVACADMDLDEVRLTSQCVLIQEPDQIRQDLQSITRLDLYAGEYLELVRERTSKKQ